MLVSNKNFDNSISSTYQQKDTIIGIDKKYLIRSYMGNPTVLTLIGFIRPSKKNIRVSGNFMKIFWVGR